MAFGVHFIMFVPVIMTQGNQEQQDKWLKRALNCEIIGTYAQTELGHGTFIRGLETRADYDPKTEEFVLSTPKLTSYKWWPGAMAHTSNYAIVMAQLYSNGQCHGIQPFIVQLRDEETNIPMPGIEIGDIGSKLGMHYTDNGYLGLKNVRIPRTNMLMRNSQVLKDGTFIKPKSSVLTYGGMTFVRVSIVKAVTSYLQFAVTIATRYSAVRRQSPIDPEKPEPQIIDHVTQQLKIFPPIAKVLIFKLAAHNIWDMYHDVSAELKQGNLDRLPELHGLSCCLKAVCSSDVSTAVETLRMSCGGHGFMNSSNFPNIYGITTAACTYEGENTVMLLQTARFLMKAWTQVLKGGKLTPTVAYLKEGKKNKKFPKWQLSTKTIIKAFQFATANKVRLVFEHLEERKNQGYSLEEATNLSGIELTQAADLHCRAYLLSAGYTGVESIAKTVSPAVAEILWQLMDLYAIEQFFYRLADILSFIDLKSKELSAAQARLESLLEKIRPNAVAIVDSFDIPDGVLSSTLGSYDGNVYERMFEEAKKSPLNQEPVNKTFHLYLKPFMKANL